MNTLVCTAPGHFNYYDTPEPVLQKGQAILRIKRIGICGTDLHAFEGTQPYFEYPRILGHELAAELVDIDGSSAFEKGDIVTILPYFNCGSCIACRRGKPNCCKNLKVCGVHCDGGMRDYLSVPANSLVKGQGLNPELLALVEPFAIAAHGIARSAMRAGDYVLVVGAGPIGLALCELAHMKGAKVITMDVDDGRLAFSKNHLGLEFAINPAKTDAGAALAEITNGDMPSVVIDATGSLKAINNAFAYMAHGGTYVLVGLQKGEINFSHPEFHKREATLMSSRNATREDFEFVIGAIKNKQIDPAAYITNRVKFDKVAGQFPTWIDPKNGVIKAMVEIDD
jgi:2-desacetyl-2-hydroxyethyl bacteriochlorophyllide A dehydrogenase